MITLSLITGDGKSDRADVIERQTDEAALAADQPIAHAGHHRVRNAPIGRSGTDHLVNLLGGWPIDIRGTAHRYPARIRASG